jgi:hypothetical protein
MDIKGLVKEFGNACALAELIGKPIQTPYYWIKINKIPRWQMAAVKKAAKKMKINIDDYLK